MVGASLPDSTVWWVNTVAAFGSLPLPMEVFARPPSQRRLPVVADANALISDVLHFVDTGFSFLTLLASKQIITLVAPAHIRGKVEQHLPVVAAQRRRSAVAALRTWSRVHEPLMQFVELPSIGPEDHRRVLAVHARDPEDGPVAQLGFLLAPSMVLTRDADLRDEGIGLAYWVDATQTLLELARLEDQMYGRAQGAATFANLVALSVGGAGRAVARWPWTAGLFLALEFMALTDWRDGTRRTVGQTRHVMGAMVERSMPSITAAFQERDRVHRQVQATLLHPEGISSMPNAAARRLAELGEPFPAARLRDDLHRLGHDLSDGAMASLLRAHPAFVDIRGCGWQLGVRGSADRADEPVERGTGNGR